MPQRIKFKDYNGPTGPYVATGKRVVPLTSAEGAAALGHSAMLSSFGVGAKARLYESKMREALEEAHAIDLELGLVQK
jgi:hypothetical protein